MKRLQELLKNEFVRHFFTLFTGSVSAQAILFAITPILTRIYPEAFFGVFFLYSSISVVLAIISTLQYELSVVLPDNDKDSINLLFVSILTACTISIFLFIIVLIFGVQISCWFDNKDVYKWLYFSPLSIFFLGIFQTFSYWNNRFKKYKFISIASVARSVAICIIQITSGLIGWLSGGLIAGLITGQAIAALVLVWLSRKQTSVLLHHLSFSRIIKIAVLYKDIPLFNTLFSGLIALSTHLPIILLPKYFGLVATGHYGLAHRVVNMPMGLINQALAQVFFRKASEIYNAKGDFYGFIKKTYLGLFKVGILPFTAAFFIAPLFPYIFGADWEATGLYAQILIPWLFIGFLNTPVSFIITILGKQRQIAIYSAFLLTFRFLALYIGYSHFHKPIYAIALYALVGFGFSILLMIYFIIISKRASLAFNK